MTNKFRYGIALTIALLLLWSPRAVEVARAQGRAIVDSVINTAPPSLAYTVAIDYDGNGNAIYVGLANSATAGGPSKAAAQWCIKRITYNGSNQATDIQWAGGSTSQTFVWNNRASLSYQ